MLGQKKNFGKKMFGKHHLCVTIRFLVFSDIADFGGVLLVTWVICTPKLSQKPLCSLCVKFWLGLLFFLFFFLWQG